MQQRSTSISLYVNWHNASCEDDEDATAATAATAETVEREQLTLLTLRAAAAEHPMCYD